jgi:hypothetical protein
MFNCVQTGVVLYVIIIFIIVNFQCIALSKLVVLQFSWIVDSGTADVRVDGGRRGHVKLAQKRRLLSIFRRRRLPKV